MLASLLTALLLLVAVVLFYWKPWGERCPQCQARREDAEHPICPECGWIYEVPDEEDEDYAQEEEEGSPR